MRKWLVGAIVTVAAILVPATARAGAPLAASGAYSAGRVVGYVIGAILIVLLIRTLVSRRRR